MCLRYRPCHHVGNSRTRINLPSPLLAWSSRPPPSSRCMFTPASLVRHPTRGRLRETAGEGEREREHESCGRRDGQQSPRGWPTRSSIDPSPPGRTARHRHRPKPCDTASAGGPMRAPEWRGRLPDLDMFDSLRDCFLRVPQRRRRLILSHPCHLRHRWAKLLVVIHHGELEALCTPIFLTP